MTNVARPRRAVRLALLFCVASLAGMFVVTRAEPGTAIQSSVSERTIDIAHDLRAFATTGRVLHIGAHPDDENTQLIAYLSRGRGFDTAYLSITRGDGGQNILGPDFDEKLGVARTQELLAARAIDGGRQFFTRAIDFGFSKSPDESLAIWNHPEVLGDVVRVIRRFQPDVIVTRFPIPPGSGGHGHHTASAILAVEAFKLAADPSAYPEQMTQGLRPWQARRIVWNSSGFLRGGGIEKNPSIRIDISGVDPVTGEPFASIAARGRAMHKTQGFGDFASRPSAGSRIETFVLLGGDAMEHDLMDGVDTTWHRVPGAADIADAAGEQASSFDAKNPAGSLPALLAIHRRLTSLPSSPLIDDKRKLLERAIADCAGIWTGTRTDSATVTPGESFKATVAASVGVVSEVKWVSVSCGGVRQDLALTLTPDVTVQRELLLTVPRTAPIHQPYWLRMPPVGGLYQVADPKLIGVPEDGPDFSVTYTFEVGGEMLAVRDALHAVGPASPNSDPAEREPARTVAVATVPKNRSALPVVVVPPVALHFDAGIALFRPGGSTIVRLTIKGVHPGLSGTAEVGVPDGWRTSAPQSFVLGEAFHPTVLTFELMAPNATSVATVSAKAVVNGIECTTDETRIHYSHIPLQLLQPAAHKRVTSVLVGTKGHSIGYLTGAGDDIPDALRQLGYRVTVFDSPPPTAEYLSGFDAVVIGVRALNIRTDLDRVMPALFEYVSKGGTVVCQYSWSRNLKTEQLAPYRLKLSDARVTDETAPVTFFAPDHAVLNRPNRITSDDFVGWVQERGAYFAAEWDDHFVPVLAMNDPGEAPLKGSLLVARYGQGYFVYTGLAFFRQLPAGVPGAYRLFANLVSLGK